MILQNNKLVRNKKGLSVSSISEFLSFTAQSVGKLIMSNREGLLVSSKGDPAFGDIVSSADLRAETFIVNQLSMKHKSFEIISEESHANNDKPLPNCFVIDPRDGTINFVNGLPIWGIQIACVLDKRTVASVINLPELGQLYVADENGAYLNGKKIHVSDKCLRDSLYSIEGQDIITGAADLIDTGYPHLREFYSTSASFSFVASGKMAASVYRCSHLWDWLPGEFLVRAAGGVSYNDPLTDLHIVANTPETLEEMKMVFCSIPD